MIKRNSKIKARSSIIALFGLLLSLSLSAQAPTTLSSPSDSLQYSLGVFVGEWLTNNGFTITDKAMFSRGMDDVVHGKPRAMNDSLMNNIISSYQVASQNEKFRQMEEQMFAELRGKEGVGALPNGVHYIITKAGTGLRPMAKDSIVFNTVGVFPDGTLFEDTFQKNKALRNIPENLIPGLNEAVQLMPEGSTWRIFVPSALAYGAAGVTNVIPPNSALVFELTLEKVIRNQ